LGDVTDPLKPKPKDQDSFKDTEIAVFVAKYNSEMEILGEDGKDDRASEEYLP
jgi:hypothetical protein